MKKLLLGGMWCLSVSVLLEGQELKSFCLVVCGVCTASVKSEKGSVWWSVLLEGQELKSFCLVVCGVCAARGSKVKKLLLGGMWCLSVSVLLEGQE